MAIRRNLGFPLAASEFDSNDGGKKVKAKKRSAIKGVMKGGVSATNLAAGKKTKAKRKAVRTAASVGRPERVAKKEIKKAIIKKNRKHAEKIKKAPKVKSQKQIKKSMKDAIIRKNKARKL